MSTRFAATSSGGRAMFSTLYARLAAVLCGLLLAIGVLFALLLDASAARHQQRAERGGETGVEGAEHAAHPGGDSANL